MQNLLVDLYIFFRHGCITSEDLFWKLDALQSFIRDLHWPDEVFGKHLEQRLKLMACDMLESCINRYIFLTIILHILKTNFSSYISAY